MSGFDAARFAALMKDLLAHLLNRPADLLSFDAVRNHLRLKRVVDHGIVEVPLDRIVGTLGREREFNRAFLPRDESLRARWDDIKDLAEGHKGFPPVELYRVGDVYFVVDGHHRVSVAKSMNAQTIEAQVREYITPVPLDSEISIEELLLKEGLADFLETTGLFPESPNEFRVTVPKGYERLLEHISVHRYYRGIETGREISEKEAIESWRDSVYRPMIDIIRKSGVLEDFPENTETDLYLFTMDHLHYLREQYGQKTVTPSIGVKHFKKQNREDKKSRKKPAKKEA